MSTSYTTIRSFQGVGRCFSVHMISPKKLSNPARHYSPNLSIIEITFGQNAQVPALNAGLPARLLFK